MHGHWKLPSFIGMSCLLAALTTACSSPAQQQQAPAAETKREIALVPSVGSAENVTTSTSAKLTDPPPIGMKLLGTT